MCVVKIHAFTSIGRPPFGAGHLCDTEASISPLYSHAAARLSLVRGAVNPPPYATMKMEASPPLDMLINPPSWTLPWDPHTLMLYRVTKDDIATSHFSRSMCQYSQWSAKCHWLYTTVTTVALAT